MIVLTKEDLEKWLSTVEGVLEFDVETTGLKYEDTITSLQLGNGKDEIFIPLNQKNTLKIEDIKSNLQMVFNNYTILKVAHNIKFDARVLARQGVEVEPPYYDTMIATALVFPDLRRKVGRGWKDKYALKALVAMFFEEESPSWKEFLVANKIEYMLEGKKGKMLKKRRTPASLAELSMEKQQEYALKDITYTRRLKEYIDARMDAVTRHIFETIEMRVLPVLLRMEEVGVKIDPVVLAEYTNKCSKLRTELEDKIYNLAGKKFTLSNNSEVRRVLYYDMRIPLYRLTQESRELSVDSDALEEFSPRFPVIKSILDWRKYEKILSTYCETYPPFIRRDGRIHSDFGIAATGRLTSSDPNLQNIPISNEDAAEIRTVFIPKEGCKLISCDYKQMEINLIAHLSEDPKLIKDIKDGVDLHAQTATLLWGSPEKRQEGKTANFSLLYGRSISSFANELGLRYHDAKKLYDKYFAAYPQVREWFEGVQAECQVSGWVSTILGRTRNLKAIADNPRSVANQALNTPVQGSGADLMKIAMIRWDEVREKYRFKTEVVLSVHDELLFEAPEEEIKRVLPYIKGVMESVVVVDDIVLKVPMRVEVEIKSNWGGKNG